METEPREPELTYLESLLDQKADEIGRTTGEQCENAIREYGALEFRLELVNTHEGRLERQKKEAMASLQKKLEEFYRMPMPQGMATMVGEMLGLTKTLGRIEGQKSFLANYIDAHPETPDE